MEEVRLSWSLAGRAVWFFLRRYIEGQAITRAKRQGVIAYIRAVQGTRRTLLTLVITFFAFNLTILSGVGALVTGMFLLNLETRTILTVLFGIFAFLFFVPIIFLCLAFSERAWYRYSGAEKMVENLRADESGDQAA